MSQPNEDRIIVVDNLNDVLRPSTVFDGHANCIAYMRTLDPTLRFDALAKALPAATAECAYNFRYTGFFQSQINIKDFENVAYYLNGQKLDREIDFIMNDMNVIQTAKGYKGLPILRVIQKGHYNGLQNEVYNFHHDSSDDPAVLAYGRGLIGYNGKTTRSVRNCDAIPKPGFADCYNMVAGAGIRSFKNGTVTRHAMFGTPTAPLPYIHKAPEFLNNEQDESGPRLLLTF